MTSNVCVPADLQENKNINQQSHRFLCGIPVVVAVVHSKGKVVSYRPRVRDKPGTYCLDEHETKHEKAQEEILDRMQAEEELAQHRDHLEELVEQRTTELNEQMEEQQKLLKMMAGREIRMAELKNVINQLRTQIENSGLEPVAQDPLLEKEEEW